MRYYQAFHDTNSAYVMPKAKRRYVVALYVDYKFQWVVGMFGTMAAAQKRADELNQPD